MKVISSQDDLTAAVEALEQGKLVAVPTDRWYMVCADAQNTELCQSIFASKNRPLSKPLILVTPTKQQANSRFEFSDAAARLANAFWPGNLALILPWKDPDHGHRRRSVGSPNALVTVAGGTLGELARRATVDLAATTINLSAIERTQLPGPAITIEDVQAFAVARELDITLAVDGGICPAANHLTIVDCTAPRTARIQRSGLVHERAITAALS